MDVLPAIDLLGGKVVRLRQGDYDRRTVYADDPLAVADGFLQAGAKWIHVVDLDAARSGKPANTRHIADICRAAAPAGAKIQTGGGIRNLQHILNLRDAGVHRLVLGSAALKDWGWFEGLLAGDEIENEHLALGLDAREGRLAVEGWTEQSDQPAVDLARRVRGSGLGAVVFTDIAQDGMLTGVNIPAVTEMVAATDVPVVASGGVGSLDDIRLCLRAGCGGVILGKALYEGRVNLREALAAGREP
jgi:phosphoribosylformimino-5-aminoimidazole carboxamide ribotide isomerase